MNLGDFFINDYSIEKAEHILSDLKHMNLNMEEIELYILTRLYYDDLYFQQQYWFYRIKFNNNNNNNNDFLTTFIMYFWYSNIRNLETKMQVTNKLILNLKPVIKKYKQLEYIPTSMNNFVLVSLLDNEEPVFSTFYKQLVINNHNYNTTTTMNTNHKMLLLFMSNLNIAVNVFLYNQYQANFIPIHAYNAFSCIIDTTNLIPLRDKIQELNPLILNDIFKQIYLSSLIYCYIAKISNFDENIDIYLQPTGDQSLVINYNSLKVLLNSDNNNIILTIKPDSYKVFMIFKSKERGYNNNNNNNNTIIQNIYKNLMHIDNIQTIQKYIGNNDNIKLNIENILNDID